MIKSKFDRLRREKAARENRDLTLRSLAAETGLSLSTIQRLNKGDMERVYLSTLDKLCEYFNISDVGDLIEFVPAESTEDMSDARQTALLSERALSKIWDTPEEDAAWAHL